MKTYYVAKTGNDRNPGTFRHPFLTVAEGLHNLENGDLLYILAGTYTEPISITNTTKTSNDVWDKTPRIAAYPGASVTLTPTSGAESKTLGYFYLKGIHSVQDPANYAGVNLVKVTSQQDEFEVPVSALGYSVGGVEYVRSAPSDLTRPVVTISTPANNSSGYGTITVTATATDNVSVVSVWLKLDDVIVVSEFPGYSCSYSWDTTLSLNGDHTLIAWAKDSSGNIGVSAPITVVVENTPSVATTDALLLNPYITVTQPMGEELWYATLDATLMWTSFGIDGGVDVYLLKDGVEELIFKEIGNTGTTNWPVKGERGPYYQIKVVNVNNPKVFGISNPFKIVAKEEINEDLFD